MAELQLTVDERPGILKEIDEGAIDLIFQAIQEDMYSFPIKSFIRETISNALDSITEKEIALDIIVNGTPQEQYYLQRQDNKLLKDSAFNKDYYDPKYLSDNSKINIIYKEDTPRDSITIKDYGVGLGGDRLKGFFKLGYSSKRNLKSVIGKFGAGAKAGLATGADYFVLTTVYNGFSTSFMIFKNDYEPITPKTSTSQEEIWKVKLIDGTIVEKQIYWEYSDKYNEVSITLEVKKHNKSNFINAIKDQFQYFKNKINLEVIDEYGESTSTEIYEIPTYESDKLIIPKYSTYFTPHILVDGIAYGTVAWNELELETRRGKIAIKVKATDVDITQSRESLKWTEKTKQVILNAIEIAKKEAGAYISEQTKCINTNNILEIATNSYKISKNSGGNNSLYEFYRFISSEEIKPTYNINIGTNKITSPLDENLFKFLFGNFSVSSVTPTSKNNKLKFSRIAVTNFNTIINSTIVYSSSTILGPKISQHILNKFMLNSFIYIRPISINKLTSSFTNETTPEVLISTDVISQYIVNSLMELEILNLDTYDVQYEEKEEDLNTEVIADKTTLATIRRLNQEVLYYDYYRTKHNIKIVDIHEKFKDIKDLIICTGKYKNLGKFLIDSQLKRSNFSNLNIIYVAENILKYFIPYGTLITDYFRTINYQTGELMIGEQIRTFNTDRKIVELFEKYKSFSENEDLMQVFFEFNLRPFYYKLDTIKNDTIIRYLSYNNDPKMCEEILQYLDSLDIFQNVVKTGDKKLIAEKALDLFNSSDIYTVNSYDEELITSLETKFEYLNTIEPVLKIMSTRYPKEYYQESKALLTLLIETKLKQNDNI